MKLNELIIDIDFLELSMALMEGKKGVNSTVASWAKKLNMSYDDLHRVWDNAAKGKGTNYVAIMGAFKKAVTSLKGVTKKQLEDGGTAKFNYKVRTQQTMDQLLDGKPAPKSAKPAEVKKIKAKISKINQEIKDIGNKPNNTAAQKMRNKKALNDLKNKKKELQASIK